MVTAILAVHKTGAAYLPVDPALPARPHRRLLADAQPALIITAAPPACPGPPRPRLPARRLARGARLQLDDPATAAAIDRQPAHRPRPLPTAPAR